MTPTMLRLFETGSMNRETQTMSRASSRITHVLRIWKQFGEHTDKAENSRPLMNLLLNRWFFLSQINQHDKMKIAFLEMECEELFSQMEVFILQHHFNGKFLVFQTNLLVDD